MGDSRLKPPVVALAASIRANIHNLGKLLAEEDRVRLLSDLDLFT